MTNIVTPNANINVVQVTSPGPLGPIGPQGVQGNNGTVEANSGFVATPFLRVTGSMAVTGSSSFFGDVSITGSLTVSGSNTFVNIGPARFTGSVNVSGSVFATTFSGSGAGLSSIPASSITGLNLTRIGTGNVSASVDTGGTSFTVNNGGSNLFTVSSAGLGTFLNGLTINGSAGIFNQGLNVNNAVANLNAGLVVQGSATLNGAAILTSATVSTSRITDSNISASVSSTGKAFSVNNGATVLSSVDQQGAISGSGLNISGSNTLINSPNIALVGSATLNGQAITTAGDLTLNQIRSGAVTASVSTGANSFFLESAGTNLFSISNTGILSGSGANLFNIPATGITGLNLSRVATGSVTASVNIGTIPFQIISGSSSLLSLDFTGKLSVSKSINVGTPTSNNWGTGLNGSYFNNFGPTTDVSEILRFVAGLLSASAPDASPNTKTFANITEVITNSGTITAPAGLVPQNTTAADIIYLTGKGFTTTGDTLFPGKTIFNNSAYGIAYSSVAGGSTIVSSSVDTELFGLGFLNSGNATQVNLSGSINQFYSDNNSETTTATSQSQNLLSNNSFSTTNGISIAKINTANPAVIPPAFQDGKFVNVLASGLFNNGRSFSSVSSSGFYHISASISISSGSSQFTTPYLVSERVFWAPISSIAIPTQTISFTSVNNNVLTATSRSLSGAPYLLTSAFNFGSTVNGVFNPLYTADSTIGSMTEVDSLVSLSGTVLVSTAGGTIQTSTAIFDSTGATARATSTVPFETDIIKMTGSANFSAGDSGATNIASVGLNTTSFILTHAGKNRSGTPSTGTQTILYHTAGNFNQPASSGSLAYYGRTSQTFDGGTLTGTTEAFTGEAFRIQLTNDVLTFTGLAWNNSFGLYNLGGKDLQVKPGNLVRPGGTYKYWLNDPDNTQDYKYYIRRFQRTSVLTSFTLNVGKTLVPWDDTSTNNAVAVGIIFESAKEAGASNCRLFDPVYANGDRGISFAGATVGTNPFTSILDYYGAGGAVAGTTYTITVSSATGMVLTGTAGSDEIYVVIRYKGDPSPVTSLTVSGT